ncbi:anti-sigma regulatory factor [Aquabacterium sp.]|uniref:anti-sigma regulatory factor n=1 Tax=Aquabacterium sp. TaxID=1872578 RepID=UPI0034503C8A
MTATSKGSMQLLTEQDIVLSRQTVRKLAQELKFSLVDQTKMITAASELSRNTVVYGGGGEMRWELLQDGLRNGLRLHFEDQGPGIPDMDLALTDGWTSGKGMGMGLTGSRRLVNEFEIRSVVGEGTCVSITRWK